MQKKKVGNVLRQGFKKSKDPGQEREREGFPLALLNLYQPPTDKWPRFFLKYDLWRGWVQGKGGILFLSQIALVLTWGRLTFDSKWPQNPLICHLGNNRLTVFKITEQYKQTAALTDLGSTAARNSPPGHFQKVSFQPPDSVKTLLKTDWWVKGSRHSP